MWSAANGVQGLGDLAGGSAYSDARAISGDGATVVGESSSALAFEAFRWTAAGGMIALGSLPGGGDASIAHGVSYDGAVIVGGSSSVRARRRFVGTR